ncbi:MAG: hypothetical protein ISP10_07550 [Aeromicrobium sp.]|nr:hypothetical protein [Aeromicrobium sp.]
MLRDPARFPLLALVCACVTVLAAATGCSTLGGTDTPAGPAFANVTPSSLVIGALPGDVPGPLGAAVEQGLFDAHGVDVTFVELATPAERDAALAARSVDAVIGDIASGAALEASGAQITLAAVVDDGATVDPAVGSRVLIVADEYIALPAGMLAVRAVLRAWDDALASMPPESHTYPLAAPPAAAVVDPVLASLVADGVIPDAIRYADLVLDLR